MAKFNFKDDVTAQHFEMQLVQDVKVNGTSVFDGEEARIRLKTINNQVITGSGNLNIDGGYDITVPSMSEHMKISNDDLAYIRANKPKLLKITAQNTGNVLALFLDEANTNSISYSVTLNRGTYELFSYYLTIGSTATYQTGCDLLWAGYIVAPGRPVYYANKTYVLKLINGTPTWVEEN